MPSLPASQSRAVASLASLYIFRMLGLFMVLPVLALSGEEYAGSNVFLLGVALGIYGLTQALLQIPFGLLSDRFGRKPLIFIGLALFACGSLVAAYSDSVVGLIVGRALQGAGAIAGVIMAMVGDLTSTENRTKAMASIGASIGIAFALALILGPFISGLTIGGLTGIRLLFWVTIVLSIIGFAIVLWAIPNPPEEQRLSHLSIKHLRDVVCDRQCGLLYLGVFVLHYVLMALFVVVPLMLIEAGIARDSHSWVYLAVMALSFVVMIPMMIVGERRHKVKHFLLSTIVILAIAFVVLMLSQSNSFVIIFCLGLFFIAFNYLEANLPSLLTKSVSPQSKGAGSGVFATCQFLGAALGGMIGGALYQQWGVVAPFTSAIILLVLWLLFAKSMVIPKRAASSN